MIEICAQRVFNLKIVFLNKNFIVFIFKNKKKLYN